MTVLRAADAIDRHGRAYVRNAVRAGRWQRPHRGVYVTHNGPLSMDDHRWVGLLASPIGSAVAGATALELGGLRGFEASEVHVAIPEGAVRPVRPGLVTHWSTRLGPLDVHPSRVPQRTRIERSLIDFASWCGNDRYARAATLAAFQQGLVRANEMYAALERRSTVRRAGLVRESVHDAVGGIHSLPETDFDDLILVSGLPQPTRQRVVRGPDGRYYLDAHWDEYGVSVEIHGLPHQGVLQWSNDLMRGNEIVIMGSRLLIFTSYVIRREPEQALDQLVRALRAGGWRGVVRPVSSREVRRARERRARPRSRRT